MLFSSETWSLFDPLTGSEEETWVSLVPGNYIIHILTVRGAVSFVGYRCIGYLGPLGRMNPYRIVKH
jgi:hypothetical protein